MGPSSWVFCSIENVDKRFMEDNLLSLEYKLSPILFVQNNKDFGWRRMIITKGLSLYVESEHFSVLWKKSMCVGEVIYI